MEPDRQFDDEVLRFMDQIKLSKAMFYMLKGVIVTPVLVGIDELLVDGSTVISRAINEAALPELLKALNQSRLT